MLSIFIRHHTDNIMLTGHCEKEVATTLDLLVTHLHGIRWGIDPAKIQGPFLLVKVIGVPRCGSYQDIPSKVKDKLLQLVFLKTKKEAQHLNGSFWILETTHSLLGFVNSGPKSC